MLQGAKKRTTQADGHRSVGGRVAGRGLYVGLFRPDATRGIWRLRLHHAVHGRFCVDHLRPHARGLHQAFHEAEDQVAQKPHEAVRDDS